MHERADRETRAAVSRAVRQVRLAVGRAGDVEVTPRNVVLDELLEERGGRCGAGLHRATDVLEVSDL